MKDKLVVGRPNLGNQSKFLSRVEAILESRWLSNHGPMVREFESAITRYIGVEHAVCVSNATAGIEIAGRALRLSGEVILPSYTFVATAHALRWQGITPVFCDIDPKTHNIDPNKIEALITPRTTGIVGVHLWGRACDTDAIAEVAATHEIPVMYDASHGFGCTKDGTMLGNYGECEVFSFHATKFINALEGGVVVTNNGDLAKEIREMSNFGFTDYDTVKYLGINAKMNEVSAAMGLTNLEAIDEIVQVNRENYEVYCSEIAMIPGISIVDYDKREKNNYQYVVIEVDESVFAATRDEIVAALHDEGVLARRYFWPGCHNMEPYASERKQSEPSLVSTEVVANKVIVLPTGQTVDGWAITRICRTIASCSSA